MEKLEALGTLCSSQTPLQHRQNMERYDGFIYIIGKDRIGYTGIKWYNVDENGMRIYIYNIGMRVSKNDACFGMS